MPERAAHVFDRQGALHEARKRMRRIVGEFHQVSLGILAAWSRYDEAVRPVVQGHNEVDAEAAGRLLDAGKATDRGVLSLTKNRVNLDGPLSV
jgi:hypothetical protein